MQAQKYGKSWVMGWEWRLAGHSFSFCSCQSVSWCMLLIALLCHGGKSFLLRFFCSQTVYFNELVSQLLCHRLQFKTFSLYTVTL